MKKYMFAQVVFGRCAVLGLAVVASLFVVGCGEESGTGAAPATGEPASSEPAGGSGTTETSGGGGSDSK